MSEMPDGAAEIAGSFTIEEAKNLASLIGYGRLPLVLTVLEPT
jgi:preprotein translocase subunit SecD